MPRGKGIYDDEDRDEPKKPTEQDREDAPDVAETDQEPTA